jgi:peptide/nickel transport system permease protein
MKYRTKLAVTLIALGTLHVVILCAGFFAPYDPTAQDRLRPYAPPTRLHFVDSGGHFHVRPFIYDILSDERSRGTQIVSSERIPVEFFVYDSPYRILGVVPARLHLFGTRRSRLYLLGSDGYGRDLFSRIVYGGQISLLAGLLGAALTLIIGLCVGAAAGYWGGWKDALLMRLAELFLALPWLYLLFAVRAFLPLSVSPTQAFLVIALMLGAVGWARPARLLRGVVLSVKERDFVRAARGFGASDVYLLKRHILPQAGSVLLTQASILVPQFVLAEITLSFVGLGVPEPVPSWGNLLATLQQYSVVVSYWWMFLPAVAIVPFFLGYLALASLLQQNGDAHKMETSLVSRPG